MAVEDNRMRAQPVVPPMQPGQIPMPGQRSTWATVIGIIAIVLASGGILSGCSSLISPFVVDFFRNMIPPGQATGMEVMDAIEEWRSWTMINSFLTSAVASLLLVVGIGLLKRRRWAVQAGVAWAILKVLHALVTAVFVYMVQQATFGAMGQQIPAAPGFGPAFQQMIGVYSAAFTALLYSAFPVFLLIWLSRAKIKADVADWP
jgi:hypothetical protein